MANDARPLDWTNPDFVRMMRIDLNKVTMIQEMRDAGHDYVTIIEMLVDRGIVAGNLYMHFMAAFNMTIPDAKLVCSWKPDLSETEWQELNQWLMESIEEL